MAARARHAVGLLLRTSWLRERCARVWRMTAKAGLPEAYALGIYVHDVAQELGGLGRSAPTHATRATPLLIHADGLDAFGLFDDLHVVCTNVGVVAKLSSSLPDIIGWPGLGDTQLNLEMDW